MDEFLYALYVLAYSIVYPFTLLGDIWLYILGAFSFLLNFYLIWRFRNQWD